MGARPRTDPRALPRAHARRDRPGRGVAGVPRPRPARAERDPRRRGARRSAPARPVDRPADRRRRRQLRRQLRPPPPRRAGRRRRAARPAGRRAPPHAVPRPGAARPAAGRRHHVAGDLRHHVDPGVPPTAGDVDRQSRPAGELAGDHVVPVAAAGRGGGRVRAAVRVALQPLPHPFVPRQLDGPALPGRRRRRGGGGGHRRADRQGVRAGAGRARPAHRHGDHAVPLADAVGADHGPLRRGAAGDPDARATGRPRLRWLAGDRGADLARRAARLRHLRRAARRAGAAARRRHRHQPAGAGGCPPRARAARRATGGARRSGRPGRHRAAGRARRRRGHLRLRHGPAGARRRDVQRRPG